VIVNTSDPNKFYPSYDSFAFNNNVLIDPVLEQAQEMYFQALNKMYDGEYEDAYGEFAMFISQFSNLLDVKDFIENAIMFLPYLAAVVDESTDDVDDILDDLDGDQYEQYTQYARVKMSVIEQNYHDAIQIIDDLLNNIVDNDLDIMLLELEAAHLYLIMVLENIRSLPPDTKYKPTNYEEYYAIEDEILQKILALTGGGSDDDEGLLPKITELKVSNFPNPFNPETTIVFSLPIESTVSIDIYNIRGQKVKMLVNGSFESGHHEAIWDGKDDSGRSVSSGIYFYRVQTENDAATRRMLLLK